MLQTKNVSSADCSRRVLNQHQKFHKAKHLIDQLPALVSEVGMDEFVERIEVLEKLKDVWERGGNASIIEICENGTEVFENSEGSTEISAGILCN